MELRCLALSAVFLAAFPAAAADAGADAARVEFFETRIRPVLAEQCYSCHSASAKKLKANLLLDSPAGLLKGGELGPAVVPGDPDKSRLIDAIRYQNPDLQMPPKRKLTDQQVADLMARVKDGAHWPGGGTSEATAQAAEVVDLHKRKASHWAWQPVKPMRAA